MLRGISRRGEFSYIMPSRYSDSTNRRQRAYEHGTERSEFLDVGQIIARNYAQKKVRGTNMTKCARCGGYFTKEERDLHYECPIAQISPPKSNSSQKQQRANARPPKNPIKYSAIAIFRVSVALVSNGQSKQSKSFNWCLHNDARLLFKDEDLLKSLAIKLRRCYNPATTTIVFASAQRKKTGETYPLNSNRLSELFQNGKS